MSIDARVSPRELEELLENGKVKVVEIRPEEDYEAGHIPGSVRISRRELEDPGAAFDGTMATPEQMNGLLSLKGIVGGEALVVSSDVGNPHNATRFWWLMSVYGNENVRVLDGNYENWKAGGHPIETGKPGDPKPSDYRVSPPDFRQIAYRGDLLALGKDSVLLDVRTRAEYEGAIRKGAGRGGRIPGAILLPYENNLDAKGFFKPVPELKKMYEEAGVPPEKEIVLYCMRAYRSTHTLFVLRELLGYPRLRNYEGSWIEWSNIPGFPVEI